MKEKLYYQSEDIYYIWSAKTRAFYAPNCQGYTTIIFNAGIYTKKEAEEYGCGIDYLHPLPECAFFIQERIVEGLMSVAKWKKRREELQKKS